MGLIIVWSWASWWTVNMFVCACMYVCRCAMRLSSLLPFPLLSTLFFAMLNTKTVWVGYIIPLSYKHFRRLLSQEPERFSIAIELEGVLPLLHGKLDCRQNDSIISHRGVVAPPSPSIILQAHKQSAYKITLRKNVPRKHFFFNIAPKVIKTWSLIEFLMAIPNM